MRSRITKQYIMLSVLAILITFTLLCSPEVAENQYAYSQSTNLTGNKTGSGVDDKYSSFTFKCKGWAAILKY